MSIVAQSNSWLGDLPTRWRELRLKYLASYNDEVLHDDTSKALEIEYVDIGSVSSKGEIGSTETMLFENAPSRARRMVRNGDVLVSTVRTYLKAIAPVRNPCENLIASTGFAVVRAGPDSVSGFLAYALRADGFIGEVISRSVGISYPAINASDLVNIFVPAPPLEEQTQIAKFLDYETAKIDALIEKQQQLIALLKEKRQAVISHAVTKGLNPDAPMRDSGVEWLGEVPAHWEVLPTKRFFRLECFPAPANNSMELLSVYTDIGVRPRKELEQKGNKASTTDGYWIVKKGDLVVNKLLAWMGAVGYSEYEGVTSPAYDILRKSRALNPKFYHYLFRLERTQGEFKRWSRGIMEMRLRLYFEELGKIQMPFPPEREQNEIVERIENSEATFEALAQRAESMIQLLQERRTALISAAVTGKIDVRNWSAPDD